MFARVGYYERDQPRSCFFSCASFHSPILFRETDSAVVSASVLAKDKMKNGVPHILESHPREQRARMGHPLHGSLTQIPKREGWATRPASEKHRRSTRRSSKEIAKQWVSMKSLVGRVLAYDFNGNTLFEMTNRVLIRRSVSQDGLRS